MIVHLLGHKPSLSKFKKTEIISSIFSGHNAMRLEVNCTKKNCKKQNKTNMKPEQYATKQPTDHWRNQRGNKKYERQMKMKTQQSKTYGTQQK